ncbi:hypothetical protein AHAS_Ahas08G0096200 [Arachis hypogaea]
MAPKTNTPSRKRKGKEPATSSHDTYRFKSKLHEENFFENTIKRHVVPEVRFSLKLDDYPKIQSQIDSRGWNFMCNPHTEVGQLMVQEFYENLWITYKDIEGVNEKTYESYVRGKTIRFSPKRVREVLYLLCPSQLAPSYSWRMDHNQELGQVIEKLCIPGSQWKLGAEESRIT